MSKSSKPRARIYALHVEQVRALLAKAGMTQAELYRRLAALGCAGQRLEVFQLDRNSNPSLDTVAGIAEILEVEIDQIVIRRDLVKP